MILRKYDGTRDSQLGCPVTMWSSYRSGVCFVLRMLRPMPVLVWTDEACSIEEIEKMPCSPIDGEQGFGVQKGVVR